MDIDDTLSDTNRDWFEKLINLFGMPPENLSIDDLLKKYHLAQNVPHWQGYAAKKWMSTQRESKAAQDGFPLIPGALKGAKELSQIIPVVGYLTVRPVSVEASTAQWLRSHGFPPAPLVSKPNEVPYDQGNKWKGDALNKLFPHVLGIVDDSTKTALCVGRDYRGTYFLFGRNSAPREIGYAIACPTWKDVVYEAKNRRIDLFTHYPLTVDGLKQRLFSNGIRGILLDIDDTLADTNLARFEGLVKSFGIPNDWPLMDIDAMIEKYGRPANHPHFQTQPARDWMKLQKQLSSAQEGLPLILGSVEGVEKLSKLVPILGYLTIRPTSVNEATLQWLRSNKFPPAPLIARPRGIAMEERNKWKGETLNELYPFVVGIVDDSTKNALAAGKTYPGTIFLFGAASTPREIDYAVACPTWEDVVTEFRKRMKDILD